LGKVVAVVLGLAVGDTPIGVAVGTPPEATARRVAGALAVSTGSNGTGVARGVRVVTAVSLTAAGGVAGRVLFPPKASLHEQAEVAIQINMSAPIPQARWRQAPLLTIITSTSPWGATSRSPLH
jgi:hypothetical protein